VTAASYRHEQVARLREAHCGDHIRDAGTARDQSRVPVDRPVPYPPMLFVVAVSGTNELAVEGRSQLLDCALVNFGVPGCRHRHLMHGREYPLITLSEATMPR
jgi:hypothetical protein